MVLKIKFTILWLSLLSFLCLYTTNAYSVIVDTSTNSPYAVTSEEITIDPKINTKSSIYDGTRDWTPNIAPASIPMTPIPPIAPIAPVKKDIPEFQGMNNELAPKVRGAKVFVELSTSAGQYFSSSNLPLADNVTVNSFGGRVSLGYINLNQPQFIYKIFVEQFEAKGSTNDIVYNDFFLNKITTTNVGANIEYIFKSAPLLSVGGGLGYTKEAICAGNNACTVSRDHDGALLEVFTNFRYKILVSYLNLQSYSLTSTDSKEKAEGVKANIGIGLAFNLY